MESEPGEEPLVGGAMTPVFRVGDTVRRRPGVGSARVHELLLHLAAAGFDGAPRFLGIDGQGRETLSFIRGEVTVDGPPEGLYGDDALVGAARLLRRLHDATVNFAPGRQDGWWFQLGAPSGGPVICHNEIGPYNAVYRSGRPVAFIDWDFAAPAPREWDIAYGLWRFVPLYDDATCAKLGWPVQPRGPRIARFLDAYDPSMKSPSMRSPSMRSPSMRSPSAKSPDIIDLVLRRQEVIRASIDAWADAGDPTFGRLRQEGQLPRIDADMRYVERTRHEWAPYLR